MTIFTNLAVLCSGIAFVFFLFFAFQENKKVFAAGTMLVLASFICLTVPIAGMLHEHKLAFFSQPGSRYFLFAWILIIVYFIAVYKYRVRLLGILVMPLASILLLIAIREKNISVVASTSDWLLFIHVGLVLISFGILCIAFAGSILYLVKQKALKKHEESAISGRLPALTTLQRIMQNSFYSGFPLLTVGAVLGILVAEDWQSIKILFGLIIWFVYAILFTLAKGGQLKKKQLAISVLLLFILFNSYFLVTSPKVDQSVEQIKTEGAEG